MHVERTKLSKENKLGDKYTMEVDRLVYDNEQERIEASRYNRDHEDTYSDHCRRQMDSTVHANMSQIVDSFKEFMSMMNEE